MTKQDFIKKLEELGFMVDNLGPDTVGILSEEDEPLAVVYLDAPLSFDTSFVDYDKLSKDARHELFNLVVEFTRDIEERGTDDGEVLFTIQDRLTNQYLVKTDGTIRWVSARHTQYDYKFTPDDVREHEIPLPLYKIKEA